MNTGHKPKKVLDCKASDHEYLHRDFHGAFCYGIKHLDDTYGPEALTEYLTRFGRVYFKDLIDDLRTQGLSALEKHWRDLFALEGGRTELRYDGDVLVLEVKECPAVTHMTQRGVFFTDRFCESTVVLNEVICHSAGYQCSCDYEPGQGRCAQRFWKE